MDTSWHMERSTPVPECGCWLWEGCCDEKGYGLVAINRVTRRAHRIGYEKATGISPGAMNVLHKCDTPSCINPAHLFLGTNSDNVADKMIKGRQAKGGSIASRMQGERQGHSKLNAAAVIAIRASSKKGKDLAREYGVCQSVISQVRSRQLWRHIKEQAA